MNSQKLCFVCSINESKYKCPKCYIRYCCLTCFKTHKEGSSCADEAKKLVPDEPKSKNEYETSEAVNGYLDTLDDDELINEEILTKLWEHSDIKMEMTNKEIREILKALNSSSQPNTDFLKFANMNPFSNFIDKCFEAIEHVNTEAKKLAPVEHKPKNENQPSEAVNSYLSTLDDEEIIKEEILTKLWEYSDIKIEMKNVEIREILKALNSSSQPVTDFLKFANTIPFGKFIDRCFEAIECVKTENIN